MITIIKNHHKRNDDTEITNIALIEKIKMNRDDGLVEFEGITNDNIPYKIILSDYTIEEMFKLIIKAGFRN